MIISYVMLKLLLFSCYSRLQLSAKREDKPMPISPFTVACHFLTCLTLLNIT